MKQVFKQYNSIIDVYGSDDFAIWLHVIGGALIAITFVIIGVLCVTLSKINTSPPRTKKNVILTQLFGFFLIACAVSRAVDIVCIWHNYAVISGGMKVLTGIIAIFAMLYIPSVLAEQQILNDINHKLNNTSEKLDQIKELNEKLTGT